jgi:Gti1/Pac2 family transcription factor
METYFGHVRTPADAIKLLEACRIGLLPRLQRRLSEKERQSIKPGSVFVWDKRETGMHNWTDGKSWSETKGTGGFRTYCETKGKPGSLMKQSFSITIPSGQLLHLISYYAQHYANSDELPQPTTDPKLRHAVPTKDIYPDFTFQEQWSIELDFPPTSSPQQKAFSCIECQKDFDRQDDLNRHSELSTRPVVFLLIKF